MEQNNAGKIKLWGRIGATIYMDKEVAKKDGIGAALSAAFINKTVFPECESYLVGDEVNELRCREDITNGMLGIKREFGGELECPYFEVPSPKDFDVAEYYSVFARIGCTIYVEELTLKEKGLEKALLEAFENDQVIADGESYSPEGWNYEEGVSDEILKPLKDEWDIESYIPVNWKFK